MLMSGRKPRNTIVARAFVTSVAWVSNYEAHCLWPRDRHLEACPFKGTGQNDCLDVMWDFEGIYRT